MSLKHVKIWLILAILTLQAGHSDVPPRRLMVCSNSSKERVKTHPRESQRTSVWKSKTVCSFPRPSPSDLKRR